jgi:DNA polymerase (family 10)
VAHDVFVEINAHPYRLDLDWRHVKTAREMGVRFVINPDAHHVSEIAYFRFGVGVARKGWLTRDQVLNTLGLADVRKRLEQRKQA